MALSELMERATVWHRKRFPDADLAYVTLKMHEEAGEVASAVIARAGLNSATGDGDVLGECADVLITMLVLLGRWFQDDDLEAAVAAKLSVLENPNSGHRSSALA